MIDFNSNSAFTNVYLGSNQLSGIYVGSNKVWPETTPPSPTGYSDQYLTFTATNSGTFRFSGNTVSYSLDSGVSWVSLASNTDTPTVPAGSKIMWKASGLTPSTANGIGRFRSLDNFTVEGNAMSLYYGDDFADKTDLSTKHGAFVGLFSGCTGLTSAENLVLPATTIGIGAYNYMFKDCTSLTTAPELPATTFNYYGGYSYMFHNCTSLRTAPELPATTLVQDCYGYMFYGCTSLTTAPALPATTLVSGCYQEMFNGCTSLTTAPVLPATTLANGCYQLMFYGCTSLNNVTCLARDISATNSTTSWLSLVSSTGTFTKHASMSSWTTGINGIPDGWTVQDAS